jgi:hypothetical protein
MKYRYSIFLISILYLLMFIPSCKKNETNQTAINKVDTIKMSSNFIELAEINGLVIRLSKNENGVYLIPIDSMSLDEGEMSPTHFSFLFECTRPPKSFSYNGVYFVKSQTGSKIFIKQHSNYMSYGIAEYINPFKLNSAIDSVNFGWTSSLMFDGNSTFKLYGNNGYPDLTKLISKHVLGPVYKIMVRNKLTFTLYSITEYDGAGGVYSNIKPIILNPDTAKIMFQIIQK